MNALTSFLSRLFASSKDRIPTTQPAPRPVIVEDPSALSCFVRGIVKSLNARRELWELDRSTGFSLAKGAATSFYVCYRGPEGTVSLSLWDDIDSIVIVYVEGHKLEDLTSDELSAIKIALMSFVAAKNDAARIAQEERDRAASVRASHVKDRFASFGCSS